MGEGRTGIKLASGFEQTDAKTLQTRAFMASIKASQLNILEV